MATHKKYLRAILNQARQSLPLATAAALSARAQKLLLGAPPYRSARTVVLYAHKDNEVATDLILEDALASKRAVFYPRFDRRALRYEFARVGNRSDLVPGAFGILEPPSTAACLTVGHPHTLIVVPGLGFSPRGERLGRGAGHYDRVLGSFVAQVTTVGLAYSFQLLDRIVQSRTDRQLDYIVTESAVYRAHGAPRPGEQQGLVTGGIPR